MTHNINADNLYSLLQLVSFDLNCYIRDIINYVLVLLALARVWPLGYFHLFVCDCRLCFSA